MPRNAHASHHKTFRLWSASLLIAVLVALGAAAPLSAQTTYTYGGHTYYITNDSVTWMQARQIATAAGGYIASITTAAENQWITGNFMTAGVDYAWIGCSDSITEGVWQWESGEPFAFNNWSCGEPNNGPNNIGQHFGQMWTPICPPTASGATWDDDGGPFYLTASRRAIIELPTVLPAGVVPQVWNGHRYFLTPTATNYADARALAVSAGGYITAINSSAENLWLTQTFYSPSPQWIGLTDEVTEGIWIWDSGVPTSFTNWGPGQPDNSGNEDYAVFQTYDTNSYGARWNDLPIWYGLLRAIIELPNLGAPVGPPPANLIPAGVQTFGGHQYFRTNGAVTYGQARQLAQSVGGYIASITSADENRFLTQVFWENQDLWIGCNDEANEGTFVWESGEPFTWTNWYAGEPNNSANGEDYGHWFNLQLANPDGRQWNDWGAPTLPNAAYEAIIEVPNMTPLIAPALSAPAVHPIGTPLTFSLAAVTSTSQIYYVDMSLTGSSPGIVVPLLGTIPLNPPLIYTELSPLIPSVFQNFVGLLSAAGNATATVFLPLQVPLAGQVISASGIFVDPSAPYAVASILNLTTTALVNPTPAVVSISPATGLSNGGTAVTLTGSNFLPGVSVTVGGIPATNVAMSYFTTINCTVPAHAAGVVDVVVTNPGPGPALSGSLIGGFTYIPNIAHASISPMLPTVGGTITLVGEGYQAGLTMTVGGVTVMPTSVTSNVIVFTMPAGTACPTQVVVTNPSTQSASINFNPAPVVSTLLPNSGPRAGGNTVIVLGANFGPGATVTVAGLAATVLSANTTSISVQIPPAAAGTPAGTLVLLRVTNPTGCISGPANNYTYTL